MGCVEFFECWFAARPIGEPGGERRVRARVRHAPAARASPHGRRARAHTRLLQGDRSSASPRARPNALPSDPRPDAASSSRDPQREARAARHRQRRRP